MQTSAIRIALVTGANKGIGFEIARYPDAQVLSMLFFAVRLIGPA
jgi:NADP-dependent 3-hydroxy acid dehydrogenase YdfG